MSTSGSTSFHHEHIWLQQWWAHLFPAVIRTSGSSSHGHICLQHWRTYLSPVMMKTSVSSSAEHICFFSAFWKGEEESCSICTTWLLGWSLWWIVFNAILLEKKQFLNNRHGCGANWVETFGKVWVHLFSDLAFIKLAGIPTLETHPWSLCGLCGCVCVKNTWLAGRKRILQTLESLCKRTTFCSVGTWRLSSYSILFLFNARLSCKPICSLTNDYFYVYESFVCLYV